METAIAVTRLSSLAHPTRLDIFRLLVKAGPQGMAAGEIAHQTRSLANTLSNNLTILTTAGLIASRREGRSIIYAARYESMSELLNFLMEDCCGGDPDICAPVASRMCIPAPTAC